MRSDEELLKEIESQDFDPNAGKTYTKKEDVQLIVAHLEQLSAQKRVNEAWQQPENLGQPGKQ